MPLGILTLRVWALSLDPMAPRPAEVAGLPLLRDDALKPKLAHHSSDILFQNNVDLRSLSFTERQRDLKWLCGHGHVPCLYLVETFPEGGPLPKAKNAIRDTLSALKSGRPRSSQMLIRRPGRQTWSEAREGLRQAS